MVTDEIHTGKAPTTDVVLPKRLSCLDQRFLLGYAIQEKNQRILYLLYDNT